MAIIYLLFIVAVFYWRIKVVKAGKNTKIKAIGLFTAYTITPIILYGIVFLALVGIEELSDTAIMGEGYARSLLFVVAGGLGVAIVATLLFSVVVLAMKVNKIDSR